MKKGLLKFSNLFDTTQPAEVVVGKREAIQGSVKATKMLANLKQQYTQSPYGINTQNVTQDILSYGKTLK